jgi:hypothetical protein
MAYASKAGRARTSASNPQAFAVCDRCGIWYNHSTLRWQFDWRGAKLQNIYILVCPHCYDDPQQQLRSIVVPSDPVPIKNPRVEAYYQNETNFRTTQAGATVDQWTGIPVPGNDFRITQDDNNRVTQQTGEPPNGLNQEPGTNANAPGNNDPGLPINTTEIPNTGPLT